MVEEDRKVARCRTLGGEGPHPLGGRLRWRGRIPLRGTTPRLRASSRRTAETSTAGGSGMRVPTSQSAHSGRDAPCTAGRLWGRSDPLRPRSSLGIVGERDVPTGSDGDRKRSRENRC